MREAVLARRRRPAGGPYRFADAGPVPDPFLEDTLTLDGRRIPSPTHPDALALYAFRLGASFVEGGRRYVDVAVTPRRGGLLRGRLRVVDTLLVLAEAELRVDRGRPDPPVTDFEATYAGTFAPAADSLWLPATFVREGRVDAGFTGSRLPTVFFRQVSALRFARVGAPGPPELWASGRRYHSPRGLPAGDRRYDAFRALLPLTPEESRAESALGRVPLRELLFREGLLRRFIPLDVEGEDDAPVE
jgi:hypothetical protein